jgi:ATP-binding cassette subfamily B multidrug efflux pump
LDILKRIFNYSARYRKQFVFAIILVMMLIGINLVTPLISRVIVDDVVKGGFYDRYLSEFHILQASE